MLILIQFLIPLTSCEIACGKNRLKIFGKVLPELHGWSFIDGVFGQFFKGYFGKLFEGQVKLCKTGNCTTQSGPRTSLNSMDGICQEMVIINHHLLVLLHIYPTR